MSTSPYWSLRFDLRPDIPSETFRVLRDVAAGQPPGEGDLATLHPVVRYYLEDWRRLLVDEEEPIVGTPVRVCGDAERGRALGIEFSQHDDEQANGGFLFWLWVLGLARRPGRPGERDVIGWHGPRRNDSESGLIHLDDAGVTVAASPRISFEEIDAIWSGDGAAEHWVGHPDASGPWS